MNRASKCIVHAGAEYRSQRRTPKRLSGTDKRKIGREKIKDVVGRENSTDHVQQCSRHIVFIVPAD